MATSMQLQLLERIPALCFVAIDEAMPALQRHLPTLPDLADARIDVFGFEGSALVTLAHGAGAAPGYGLQLAPQRELMADELRPILASARAAPLGKLQARHYRPILIALDVFQKQRPEPQLAGYQIELVGEGEALVVLFSDLRRPAGTRGSIGQPGFEVELNAKSLQVVRANRVR